ncbi:beta strand repeat-containing protein [Roseomonas sp. CCTCC AB2023176]|uniref:beta strand repeat-containing protein n=1 Tax=Roseomonas sp. CCTCC AB2023176 TaxID=3342640 RepID=UPI0035DBE26A
MTGITTLRAALLAGTALAFPGLAVAQPAPNARPQGGQVVAGTATINQSNAARTQVTQTTDRAVLDWRSFDIGRDHTVQFQQPAATSMTLNRVTGPDPSQIAGRIQANGGVAIVNQSGVVFHQGAQVDVGTLVVSTANTTNQAFMRGGRLVLDQPGRPDARIENNGGITVRDTGLAALVAPQVANRGTITARMGRVALGGAETSVVDLHGDGMLALELTSPVRQRPANGGALVSNDGTITATGGTVQLTAAAVDGIVQDLVRAGGRINADTDASTGRTGRVVVAGNGGSVRIEGEVTARGLAGGTTGGSIQAIGSGNTLVAGAARVDASGRAGGGRVALGTDGRGSAAAQMSRRTGVAAGATVRADATDAGRGGTVLVNSTEYTAHAGAISAAGGPAGGDGGFVEVSGQAGYRIIGGTVNVRAGLGGQNGTFLLDPTNITIVAGNGTDDGTVGGDGLLAAADPPTNAQIGANFVNGFTGDLRLEATNDITVSAAINRPANPSFPGAFTLVAGNAIQVDASITNGSGSVTLDAGGQIRLNATLSAQGSGSVLNLTSGTGVVVAPGVTALTATSGITLSGGTVSKASGNLTFATFSTTNVGAPVLLSGGDLAFNGSVSMSRPIGVPDANRVTLGGNLTQTNGAGITAGTLAQTGTASTVNALGDNSVGTIETLDAFFGISFRNLRSLTVSGSVDSTSSFVTLDVVGDLTIGNRASLTAGSGAVTATATGNFTAEELSNIRGEGVTLSAGGTMTLGGDVISRIAFGSAPEAMALTAGAGGITQTGGRIFAGRLELTTPGDVSLAVAPPSFTDGNLVDVITANVGGNLSFVGTGNSASDLTLDGVTVGRALSLTLRATGSIVQTAGSVVTADTLNAEVRFNGLTLEGDNRIANLGDISVESPFSLRNVTSLNVVGTVAVNNASASLVVDGGDLSIRGTLRALGGVDARASGTLRVEAGGIVESTSDFGSGFVSLSSGSTSALGDPTLTGGIVLAGRVGRLPPGDANFVTLAAGTDGIVQTGGQIVANEFTVISGGSALLNGAAAGTPNSIAVLPGGRVAGRFILDNGVTNIQFGSSGAEDRPSFTANGIGLRTTGSIRNFITDVNAGTGTLSLEAGSFIVANPTFDDPGTYRGRVVEFAPASARAVAVNVVTGNPGEVVLPPILLANTTAAVLLRIGATGFGGTLGTTATDVRIAAPTTIASALDLRTTGNVTQAAAATLSSGTLSGVAGGAFTLANAGNALAQVADIAAGGSITLRTSGGQTILGTLEAPTVSLTTGGLLQESGAGRILAGTLSLATGNGAILTGANEVSRLAASSFGGSLDFVNTAPTLTVPAGNLVNAAGGLGIAQTGDLTVDGTVSGTTTSLVSTGTTTVNGNSAIARTGALVLGGNAVTINGLIQAAGAIRLDATGLATLGGRAVGTGLTITAPTVTFTGLDAATTPVDLRLGAAGTASGTLSAAGLRVFGGSGVNLFGSIAGVPGEPAAALGQRGAAGGTILAEPLPNQTAFLFNDCPIGVAVCRPVVVTPPSPPPPSPPPLVVLPDPVVPPVVVAPGPAPQPVVPPSATDLAGLTTVADGPFDVPFASDPAANPPPLDRLRPTIPEVGVRLFRDRSEQEELAPPNIRGEDY